ncbi:hypothetical protein BC629DRAFT_971410 [Irpex lacteus]|nr:hypothetical protein BC629DRAFT_971410 [Irpex lacteus]
MMNTPKDLFRTSTMPLTFVAATTSTLAGLISDGLLAWRFYVVFGRQRWAFWAPTVAIIVNTLLGLSGDFELLGYYHNPQRYTTFFQLDTFKINAAWGWFTFSINTALSGGIIGRIIYISQNATRNSAARPYSSGYYATAVAAIIESALITWVGLLLYGIASLAPTGAITTAWNIGFVMVCIIPIFFGISQCLITARLGFANEQETRESKHAILGLPSSQNSKGSAEEMAISVRKETVDDSESSVIGILGAIGEKV